jgi:hypothetical protein
MLLHSAHHLHAPLNFAYVQELKTWIHRTKIPRLAKLGAKGKRLLEISGRRRIVMCLYN